MELKKGLALIPILGIFLSVVLAGCIEKKNVRDVAIELCIKKCKESLQRGENLSRGPCLSNQIVEDWVCDVAHWPREEIDNLKENQCPAYGSTAHHFVEVDPQCNFIRAI